MSNPQCRNCLTPLLPTDRYCPNCGEPVPRPEHSPVRVALKGLSILVVIFVGIPASLFAGVFGGCIVTVIASPIPILGTVLGLVVGVACFIFALMGILRLYERWWRD